jgi:AraC-like DNA-binding protein
MKTTIEDKYAVKLPVTRLQWQGQPGKEMVPSEFEEITVASPANKNKKVKLYIKNMVSTSCIIVVKSLLDNLQLQYSDVELGKIEIAGALTEIKRNTLKDALRKSGYELLEDSKYILIEKIKNIIVEMVHYDEGQPKSKFSEYLSQQLNHNYTYLSNLFSKVKGTTIEHCILAHKIERVKELLIYNELTLSEIAWKLNYSSVAHLSYQFKKITGFTPTHFKNMKDKKRIALEYL